MSCVNKKVCFGLLFTTFIIMSLPVNTYSQYCSVLRGLTGPVLSEFSQRVCSSGFTLTPQHPRWLHSIGLAKVYSHL